MSFSKDAEPVLSEAVVAPETAVVEEATVVPESDVLPDESEAADVPPKPLARSVCWTALPMIVRKSVVLPELCAVSKAEMIAVSICWSRLSAELVALDIVGLDVDVLLAVALSLAAVPFEMLAGGEAPGGGGGSIPIMPSIPPSCCAD